MQTADSEIPALTIIIPTLIILILGSSIVYFLFLYQKKRFRHEQEVIELRETFNQTLLLSKLEIQEQTLDHIAKELHANFSHLVALININLAEVLPKSADSVKENILETKSLAKQLLSELKALSASLNTDHIMKIGFNRALENELTRIGKIKRFTVKFEKTGDPFRMEPSTEIILFRLCQEVLNNTIQYSKADLITVSLLYTPEMLQLNIADNGIGFDIEQSSYRRGKNESTGLLNMEKRASLIEGKVLVQSEEGKGTNVTINIQNKQK